MRNWLSLLGCVVLLLGVGACETDPDDDSADDDDDNTDDDDDDNTDDDDTAPPVEPYLTGHLVALDTLEDLVDCRSTVCQGESCRFQNTDADGIFLYGGMEEGSAVFDAPGHVCDYSGGYLSGLGIEFDMPAAGFLDAGDVPLPVISSLVDTTESGTFELGDGVTVTLDFDAMDFVYEEEPALGTVEVAEEDWGYYVLPEGAVIHGVWAAYPYGTMSDASMPVALPGRGELECDQVVDIYTVIKGGGAAHEIWELAATGTYDCGGDQVVTDEGEGILQITWIAYGVAE